MSLKRIQKNWETFGREDPLWAVLTREETRGNKWDVNQFFLTGEKWLNRQIRSMPGTVWRKMEKHRALDFGCGVGRISRALSAHFEEVIGVDVAPSMIEQARDLNAGYSNIQFVLNEVPHLRCFPDNHFNFVNTIITLQHLPRKLIKAYLTEFARILQPGGLLFFQLPVRPDHQSQILSRFFPRNLYHRLMSKSPEPVMDMHWIPQEKLLRFLERKGFRIEQVTRDQMAGPEWTSFTFLVSAAKESSKEY